MADVNELEVKTNGLLPAEIKLSPSGIRKQHLKTDLQHTLSLIAGYDGHNEHVAKVDETGKLMVNAGTSSMTDYEAYNITVDSTTPSAANVNFINPVSEVDLKIDDNDVNVALVKQSTNTLGDVFTLPQGNASIPFTTSGLTVWCNVSGGTSTVQVIGWR